MTLLRYPAYFVVSLVLVPACTDDDLEMPATSIERDAASASLESVEPPAPADRFAGCERSAVEPDLLFAPLAGPGVETGALVPGEYVVSTTYLQIKTGKNERLQELMGPVMSDLGSRPGLVALSLGNSRACNVARTLTVWRDDAAMLEFVVGDAHTAAIRAVSELSRGGSVVTHWTGDQDSANWQVAAEHLAALDGPMY